VSPPTSRNPHLLPLFDSGEADGLLYYVMPLVEGESLRARLDRERRLPVAEAVRIATAVLGALDYAHRHGVIHRDLKPENILLHDGEPLVADFGIALAVTRAGGERFTQTGMSLGTPQYMSPEQASAERTIDGESDIYALGAVLYEMLSGGPPHTGHTTWRRAHPVRHTGVRHPSCSHSERSRLLSARPLPRGSGRAAWPRARDRSRVS
jgi:serine/threonine protein kinase